MLILAIDTSTKIGSVALYDTEKGIISEITVDSGTTHSENIMDQIDQAIKFSKKRIQDVDRISVCVGPGSFTGIRIGVAVAKGLAYPLGKEIVGVNQLDAIASLAGDFKGKIVPLIDARKERCYYSIYKKELDKLQKLVPYADTELVNILKECAGEKTLFLGDGSIVYRKQITEIMGENAVFYSPVQSLPRAGVLGEISAEKAAENLMGLEPYYVNKSQAEREKEAAEKEKI